MKVSSEALSSAVLPLELLSKDGAFPCRLPVCLSVCLSVCRMKVSRGQGAGTMRLRQFLDFLRQVGFQQSDEIGKKLFHAFDRDNSGQVDFAEFSGALSIMCSTDQLDEKIDFVFGLVDIDGDGAVSAAAVRLWFPACFR
eukprot:SAG22_NODE_388_length_11295_cov_14.512594_11_plen_140_part_00